MSKPTHILVSIEEWKALQDKVRNSHGAFDNDDLALSIENDFPRIDLSEEGIKDESEKAVHKHYGAFYDAYEQGYQQCAKDLLNSKL